MGYSYDLRLAIAMTFVLFDSVTVRVFDKLHIKRGILLLDAWGKVYFSFEKKNKWNGNKEASVYPISGVGHVVLNEDGSTGGGSLYFIKEWKYLSKRHGN